MELTDPIGKIYYIMHPLRLWPIVDKFSGDVSTSLHALTVISKFKPIIRAIVLLIVENGIGSINLI